MHKSLEFILGSKLQELNMRKRGGGGNTLHKLAFIKTFLVYPNGWEGITLHKLAFIETAIRIREQPAAVLHTLNVLVRACVEH
jgi:hypothetical protein